MVNFGKYTFTVLYYATLSLYRIDQDKRFQAVFITFALLNAIYCSVWDLAMDFSLCNPYAKHPFLREVLAFHRPWVYYLSMVVDVIIRFNWILYAIFTHDLGHAKVMSFVVSFSEVCRRGMWSIFRVENEHCTNVVLFRASRDVPLPYELPRTDETPRQQGQSTESVQLQDRSPTTPPDVEQGGRPTSGPRPRRPPRVAGISRVGTILASAHAQDFERRKLPEQMHESAITNGPGHSPEDTSEEEYEEDSNDHLPKDDDAVEELPFVNSQARNDDETGPPSLRS